MSERRLPANRWAAVAALLIALASAASFVQVRSYDLWWHLEAGEQILGNGSIPRADDFSFTSRGAPWVDHEWLSQVVLQIAYTMLGETGLFLTKTVCALGVLLIGFAFLRRTLGGACPVLPVAAALAIAGAAILGFRFRLAERPETLGLPFAAAAAAILVSLMAAPSAPSRRLALLGALTGIWGNLHAGALLAPALCIACAAGVAGGLLGGKAPDRQVARSSLAVAGAGVIVTSLALLANPSGYRIFLVPAEISAALSPSNLVNPEWLPPRLPDFPYFFVAAGVTAALASQGLSIRSPLAAPRAGMTLLLLALGATSARHVGLFFVLLPMMLERRPLQAVSGRLSLAAATPAVLLLAAAMVLSPPWGGALGIGLEKGRFPERAAEFVHEHMPDARLYNDVAFGGYLIWRGYPQRRVFVDGRNEVHAELLGDLSAALDDGLRWQKLLDRHGVEGAVVSYRAQSVPARDAVTGEISERSFSSLHFPRSSWALVHWDDTAMVFVRRNGRFASLAAQREYRWVDPEAWRQKGENTDKLAAPSGLAQEIERKLREEPGCQIANAMARVYRVGARFRAD